jgi:hypothetical protein
MFFTVTGFTASIGVLDSALKETILFVSGISLFLFFVACGWPIKVISPFYRSQSKATAPYYASAVVPPTALPPVLEDRVEMLSPSPQKRDLFVDTGIREHPDI